MGILDPASDWRIRPPPEAALPLAGRLAADVYVCVCKAHGGRFRYTQLPPPPPPSPGRDKRIVRDGAINAGVGVRWLISQTIAQITAGQPGHTTHTRRSEQIKQWPPPSHNLYSL